MYDLVFQRICRDDVYRSVLSTLIDQGYLPVYHVRTADENTYWGGIIAKERLPVAGGTGTQGPVPGVSMEHSVDSLAAEREAGLFLEPGRLIQGKNRLGEIMRAAMDSYRLLQKGHPMRSKVIETEISHVPNYPLTPLCVEAVPTKSGSSKRAKVIVAVQQQQQPQPPPATSSAPAPAPPTPAPSPVLAAAVDPPTPRSTIDDIIDDFDSFADEMVRSGTCLDVEEAGEDDDDAVTAFFNLVDRR